MSPEKRVERRESWPMDAGQTGVFWSGREVDVAALLCGARAHVKGTTVHLSWILARRMNLDESCAEIDAAYKFPAGKAAAVLREWDVHKNAIRRAERRARDWRSGYYAAGKKAG